MAYYVSVGISLRTATEEPTEMTAAEMLKQMIADLDAEEQPVSKDTKPATEYDDPNFLNV